MQDQNGNAAARSMRSQAFSILGIAPTEDGRAIRAAFLRLARIYHPDRFVDMGEDVRREAERRMKDATLAYEILRGAGLAAGRRRRARFDDLDSPEQELLFRHAVETRRREEQRDRERWQRWEDVERLARERKDREAEFAARIASELDPAGDNPRNTSHPMAIEQGSLPVDEPLDDTADDEQSSASRTPLD